ncbi:MAG TPA: Rrf2 family transcriptional regulator [Bryobacteraceae bacterium]|nr:Rrf2 family transcriptional regulator [Bryobacteraceae bacterium]
MLKLTKKADYALIALRHLSVGSPGAPGSCEFRAASASASAKDIADCYGIPLPLLSKVLRTLVHEGLLTSEQGANGGYKLARHPRDISALEVIRAIDGPIILTHCFTEHAGHVECDQTTLCPVREPLRKVHEGIMRLLAGISVADLSQEEMPVPVVDLVSGIQPSRIGRPQ